MEAVRYAADIINITRERLLTLDSQQVQEQGQGQGQGQGQARVQTLTQPQASEQAHGQAPAYLNALHGLSAPYLASVYGTDNDSEQQLSGGGGGPLGSGSFKGGSFSGGRPLGSGGRTVDCGDGSLGGVSESFDHHLLHGGLSEAVGMTDLRQVLQAVREVVEWTLRHRVHHSASNILNTPPPSEQQQLTSRAAPVVSQQLILPHHLQKNNNRQQESDAGREQDLTDEIDSLRGKLRRADKHYVVMCRTIEQLEGEIKTQVISL